MSGAVGSALLGETAGLCATVGQEASNFHAGHRESSRPMSGKRGSSFRRR
ncbi:MAG: hypothetical protein ABF968_07245 [Acetobacter sp.]